MPLAPGPALLAVAHGSADPRAAAANEALLRRVAALLPHTPVRLAYLDHAGPTVPEALDAIARSGSGEAIVLPLLLTVGYHSRTDIPRLLRDAPVPVRYGRVLGPDPLLALALDDRLAQSRVSPGAPVVLAAAGSSDPQAARDVEAMAELLAARRRSPVRPAYASAIGPAVAEALGAAGSGAAVATYFLAPGRLPDRVAREAAAGFPGCRVSRPLTVHPAVARTLLQRYTEVQTTPQ